MVDWALKSNALSLLTLLGVPTFPRTETLPEVPDADSDLLQCQSCASQHAWLPPHQQFPARVSPGLVVILVAEDVEHVHDLFFFSFFVTGIIFEKKTTN